MKAERSLRRRIVAAYVLLAAVLCSLFGAAAFFTVESIESEVIGRRLQAEFDRLVARQRAGLSTELPVATRAYRGGEIPANLRALAPGLHEIADGERTLQVLVGHDGAQALVLAEDATDYEEIELTILAVLTAAFVACLLLAWLLARISASRVIAPLTRLAEAVQRDAWADDLPGIDAPDETGMLARAFAARTLELRRYLVRERLFTGDVSHELRTPLTVILGAAELIGARLADPALAQAAARIRRTALEATQRVTALLLLSRSPESLDAPRTALRPLVEEELERCRPLLEGKPVELVLRAEGEASVFARPELASIAIGNLIRNACQSTERGSVTVRLAERFATVEDTGPGVPEAVRRRLFERFVRGSDDAGSGSGLGLAIVKRVTEHLGWGLRLEQPEGGGARFVLTFPA